MTQSTPAQSARPVRGFLGLTSTQWFIVAMIVGVVIGLAFPKGSQQLKVVSTVFLNLIKCIVVPLIFSTLVVGIAGHSDDLKAMGRMALKSIIYFEVVTTLALFIGLIAVNITKPGVGVSLTPKDKPAESVRAPLTTAQIIERAAPESLFRSAAENNALQVVVFAVLFGVALAQVQGKPRETMLNFFEGMSEVMFKFTRLVMKLAPFGICAAMAVAIGSEGIDALKTLALVIVTLYGAVVVFVLAVLLPAAMLAKIPFRKFLSHIKEPAAIAFSTTSSEAALPSAMVEMVKLGVPKRVVSFVMPAGYSFNLDGTTLYLSVALMFVAQAAGVQMTFGQQVLAMLTLMLTSKGAAGVPRAALVVLAGTLPVFSLPPEGVYVLLSIDVIMDMARTTLNLVGNCLASAVIARWEGEFPAKTASNP